MKTLRLSLSISRDEGEASETAEIRYSTACNRIIIVGDLFPAEYQLFNQFIEAIKKDAHLYLPSRQQ